MRAVISGAAPSRSGPDLALTPEKALRLTRLLWLALLLGPVMFLGVIALLLASGLRPAADPALALIAGRAAEVAFPVLVALAFFLRGRVRATGQESNASAIDPAAFLRGHLLFSALCEGASVAATVASLLRGTLMPDGAVAIAALVVLGLNMPRGDRLIGRD